MLDTLTNYDQLTSTSSTYLNHSLTHHQSSPVITSHLSSQLRPEASGRRPPGSWDLRSIQPLQACLQGTFQAADLNLAWCHNQKQVGTFQNQNNMVDGYSNFIKQPKSNWWLNNVEQCWTMIQYTTIYDEQVQWRMTKWELTWWAELSCSSFAMRFFHSCIRYQRKNKGKQWQTSKWCIFLLT